MKLKLLPPEQNRNPKSWLLVVLFLGMLGGVFARVFWLSYPHVRVFDEVYFPVFAQDYLTRVNFFDVHPPLGKLIIAAGIWLFGDNGVGWRVMPLLFGLATIWLVGWLWYVYTKDKLAAVLAAFLVAIDGIFIAYSRTGLMDGLLFFLMFATLLAMARNKKKVPILWVATLLGLAVSIKWVGLAIVVPVAYLAWRRGKLAEFLFSLWWSLAVYLVVVGIGQWLVREPNLLNAIVEWHYQSAHYQATLTATHPYSSPWWSWPFMTRPVLFIYDGTSDGPAQVMTTLGNPLVWWASTVAVVGSIWAVGWEHFKGKLRMTDHPLFLPLLGWGASFLPFVFVHRVMFLYHYLPAYGFAILMLAYWLAYWFRREPWAVVGVCFGFLLTSIYFFPLFVGWWPLSTEALAQHIWFKRWLY